MTEPFCVELFESLLAIQLNQQHFCKVSNILLTETDDYC